MTLHEIDDVLGNTYVIDTDILVLSSDLHINHYPNQKTGQGGILKYGRGNRFTSIPDMNRELCYSLVAGAQNKQLVLLGDLTMNVREIGLEFLHDHLLTPLGVDAIPFVPGNHDHSGPWHKDSMKWARIYADYGFYALPTLVTLKGTEMGDVDLCHFPWEVLGDHTGDVRYREFRPPDRGNVLLHGHMHGTKGSHTSDFSFDVGVDAWDYAPVSFKYLVFQHTIC